MKELKTVIGLHLLLGPLAIWIMAEDAAHPERWDVWYRNPYIAIPYCIVMETFVFGSLVYFCRQERWDRGTRLLQEALQLRSERRYDEADTAYQEGLRLTGLKRH